uniref:CCT-eta n=1 Tax=Chrysotila carterae TaxID=13221 RepID=A0A6S9TJZ6_CHRCT
MMRGGGPGGMLQPQIVLLREGTDTSQGKPQLISNINACQAIVDVVRTTLGPRGMDKLIHDDNGRVTISNDGATLMKQLQIVHPAGKTLVDISMSQDAEVGDGTTSVVLLAGEFLRECKPYIEEGVHPQVIVKAFREACKLALGRLDELEVKLDMQTPEKLREMLEKSAGTSLSSKLVSGQKAFFAKMVVDAVLGIGKTGNLDMIGMKKVPGGSLIDSMLVEGVAFKKTFSYAGFEQMTKYFDNPKIVLLNVELELKAERDNAEVRVADVAAYQRVVDAEWDIIYDKLAKIVASGASIVLSRLAIGDLATQYFADRGLFCAGRVAEDDLKRVAKATGAVLQTSCNDLSADIMGSCGLFEERQVARAPCASAGPPQPPRPSLAIHFDARIHTYACRSSQSALFYQSSCFQCLCLSQLPLLALPPLSLAFGSRAAFRAARRLADTTRNCVLSPCARA